MVITALAVFVALTFAAWRRYLWASDPAQYDDDDKCPYSLTDVFGKRPFVNAPHQEGVRWLTDVFSRSAKRFPHLTALQIPHTGESLTFAELDARAENIAAGVCRFLTGPDQVVAVVMSQDNWQIVASHLGVLKAGGTLMFLDTTLPDALIDHMLTTLNRLVLDTWTSEVPRSTDARRHVSAEEAASKSSQPGSMTRRSGLRRSSIQVERRGCRRESNVRTRVT